jgi:hypothetical protein
MIFCTVGDCKAWRKNKALLYQHVMINHIDEPYNVIKSGMPLKQVSKRKGYEKLRNAYMYLEMREKL